MSSAERAGDRSSCGRRALLATNPARADREHDTHRGWLDLVVGGVAHAARSWTVRESSMKASGRHGRGNCGL